jgi:putative peptidoglycan lipid II flippase
MPSSSRSLLTTNALVAAMLAVGIVNNIAIATFFGLTRRVDAYYAALTLPNLFMILFLDYLGKNFLPVLAKARQRSPELAAELTSSIVTIVGLLALGVALLLALVSRPVFSLLLPGFSPDDIVIVCRYFWIMAPAIVLMAITVFHEYVCQHDERYVRITLIRAALPLANLAAIVVASPFVGEYALPAGYLLGNAVVAILMAGQARYRYRWRIAMRREWEGRVFSNSAIVMGTGVVARTRGLILNYVGSLLGSGAISAIEMSNKLIEPLGRTVFTAVRMWMFSRTARLAVHRDSAAIARLYDVGLGASFLVLTPLLWWMGLNGRAVVGVLFVHGEFDLRMASLVTLALIGAVPSVVFTGVNVLLSNAFYALERIVVPAVVMPLGTLVYVVLALVLARRYGVLGLTLSTTVAAVVVFLIMAALLAREIPQFRAKGTFVRIATYTLCGGVAFGLPALWLQSPGIPKLAAAAAGLPIGLALYVLVLLAVKDPILTFLYQYSRKAFGLPRPVDNAST